MTTTVTEQGWRAPQVMTVTGVSYRCLLYWDSEFGISPSLVARKGSGYKALYSALDVLRIAAIMAMIADGLAVSAATTAAKAIFEVPERESYLDLVWSNGVAWLANTRPDGFYRGRYILPLMPLTERVRVGLEELS